LPESYASADEVYCYPGSMVLRNLRDLRSAEELELFETAMTSQRAEEPLPEGELDFAHYCAIHRHLFQDIYSWAGEARTVRTGKGANLFCYPENIDAQMTSLFAELRAANCLRALDREKFVAGLASFLATLNAIHPFREGNGRTQLVFVTLIAHEAGYPLNLEKLREAEFLTAMIESFAGSEANLCAELDRLID
jgi:cell filamentation protein